MTKKAKLQKIIQSLFDQLTDEEIAALLEPCQKLTVTLSFLRGHSSIVDKQGLYKISNPQLPGVRELLFPNLEPIGHELWKQIFKLRTFSRTPERMADQRLRNTLLKLQREGTIRYEEGYSFSSPINQVLHANKIPCRMVIIDDSASSVWARHFRMCELK